jgi:LAO/AO transport system kinase
MGSLLVPEEEPELDSGGSWTVPVLSTVAQTGEGVEELVDAVARHRHHLTVHGGLEARRKARAASRVRDVVERELTRITWNSPAVRQILEEGADRILDGTATPYSLAAQILRGLVG